MRQTGRGVRIGRYGDVTTGGNTVQAGPTAKMPSGPTPTAATGWPRPWSVTRGAASPAGPSGPVAGAARSAEWRQDGGMSGHRPARPGRPRRYRAARRRPRTPGRRRRLRRAPAARPAPPPRRTGGPCPHPARGPPCRTARRRPRRGDQPGSRPSATALPRASSSAPASARSSRPTGAPGATAPREPSGLVDHRPLPSPGRAARGMPRRRSQRRRPGRRGGERPGRPGRPPVRRGGGQGRRTFPGRAGRRALARSRRCRSPQGRPRGAEGGPEATAWPTSQWRRFAGSGPLPRPWPRVGEPGECSAEAVGHRWVVRAAVMPCRRVGHGLPPSCSGVMPDAAGEGPRCGAMPSPSRSAVPYSPGEGVPPSGVQGRRGHGSGSSRPEIREQPGADAAGEPADHDHWNDNPWSPGETELYRLLCTGRATTW